MGVVQARALDRKVREAWVGHRAMVIVDNSTSFKTKVLRVANAVCRAVGAPGPNARIRRFVLPVVRPIPPNSAAGGGDESCQRRV